MHQKSRLVSLCFSRQRWSGSLGFFVLFWTHLGPTKTPTLTPPEKSLLYSYLIFECVCLLLLQNGDTLRVGHSSCSVPSPQPPQIDVDRMDK